MSTAHSSSLYSRSLHLLSNLDRIGMTMLRIGAIVVLGWIGVLKVAPYECRGIVPFMANSPFFSWMLNDPANYAANKMPEGAVDPAKEAWHIANGTYPAAYFVGITIVVIAVLLAAHWFSPTLGALGGVLLFGMSLVTLSFLITTPEVWVPDLGDQHHGFPYLAVPGRLVIKDAIMLGASIVLASESAKKALAKMETRRAA
ncbi:DUF417 family protein [Schaalia canis]|uniref:DUF417 domain-containing protein n=1 Tax=Schaalia canis TaxID=100469 RepID=A0A3P1SGF9_9ACTO|nr:DUF417 family protein [Schaalia canis]RRC96238.1 DUF417 domain-containing protein [Schaalia canis]